MEKSASPHGGQSIENSRVFNGFRSIEMAIEAVKSFFAGHGLADRVIEFEVSSATVELIIAASTSNRSGDDDRMLSVATVDI